jgi:tetratricopeptide (TPR) repeat protein
VVGSLGALDAAELGVLVDVLLTWRALNRFDKMVELFPRLPAVLRRSVMVREQFAFALNRMGRRDEALEVLEGVLTDQGPSSETLGLIGRIHKDRWADAKKNGKAAEARGYLKQAIDVYVRGFEADPRDAYPGVNAVTLLDIKGDPASLKRKRELLPVVRYAAAKRVRGGKPDYWDHATLLELAVLEGDEESASAHLDDALAMPREPFYASTTANNLSMIQEARKARGVDEGWLSEIIETLRTAG